jgi:hypothetical protein
MSTLPSHAVCTISSPTSCLATPLAFVPRPQIPPKLHRTVTVNCGVPPVGGARASARESASLVFFSCRAEQIIR